MDDYEYHDEQDRPARSIGSIVWNLLTVLVLLTALCVAAAFLFIFVNPTSGFNPFPPPTQPVALALPTATPTPRGLLPATWTPLPTREATQTNTPHPTATEFPTETPFVLFTPTPGGLVTATPGGMPYVLSPGSPKAISSVTFRPDDGCDWMGVAGSVVNAEGAPVSTGVIIQLGGSLNGESISLTSLTGVAPQYGQAGYEIFLGEEPVASKGSLWVQLLDQASQPLSDKVFFDTYEDCEMNLIFVNFSEPR